MKGTKGLEDQSTGCRPGGKAQLATCQGDLKSKSSAQRPRRQDLLIYSIHKAHNSPKALHNMVFGPKTS